MTGNKIFTEAIFSVAEMCSRRRIRGYCSEQFSNFKCNECKHYIGRYIDVDKKQMELFMYQSDVRAREYYASINAIKKIDRSTNFGLLIIYIFVFLMFGGCVWSLTEPGYGTVGNSWLGRLKQDVSTPRNVVIPNLSPHQNIQATLQAVARDLNNKVDVNKDGLINCIDAAVLFYKYYPVKSDVCILVNKNDKTEMHHLFNGVLIDGVWRAIEPQGTWRYHSSYFMRDIWGNQYDSTLNKDVTNEYSRFAR